jgi:hypothetical protein
MREQHIPDGWASASYPFQPRVTPQPIDARPAAAGQPNSAPARQAAEPAPAENPASDEQPR